MSQEILYLRHTRPGGPDGYLFSPDGSVHSRQGMPCRGAPQDQVARFAELLLGMR